MSEGVVAPSRPRRRPSGAAPPLPRDLRKTGAGWLIGAVVAIVATVLIFRNERSNGRLRLDPLS